MSPGGPRVPTRRALWLKLPQVLHSGGSHLNFSCNALAIRYEIFPGVRGTKVDMKPTTGANSNGSAKGAESKKRAGRLRYHLPADSLSPREMQVCKLLIEGLALKEVALRLSISVHTADCHTRKAYQKLGLHNRGDLIKHFAPPNVIAVRDTLTDSISPRHPRDRVPFPSHPWRSS